MGIIKAFKLGFDYLKYDEDGNVEATQRAVNDVNLDIEAGDSVENPPESGDGFSESGQPDHWYGCGRGCRLWS